ncbi:MAG: hypothetical protein LBC41_05755, partial [Clostridiales bacterium]|nr:hypothetical protein [Clostridiales bacterium]
SVPGAVQYDLLAAGVIENPYASTKAALAAEWVARTDWAYKAEFGVSSEDLSKKHKILRFEGIDTFSEIWLNGELLGETANAYRAYEYYLSDGALKESGNILEVKVKSHDSMIADKAEAAKAMKVGDKAEGLFGKSHLRRYQRSFYSGSSLLNLGTGVLGIGIYRPVQLVFHKGAHVKDFSFKTLELGDGYALCSLSVEVEGRDGAILHASLSDSEGIIADFELDTYHEFRIKNPKLWWPAGWGTQHLYELTLALKENGKAISQEKSEVGIRTVRLVEKQDGRNTFQFHVNNKPIVIQGENHIPLDYIKVYRDEAEYDKLFMLLKNQGANMLRLWGGGAVESQSFYQRCDKLGILLWQEMFLHSCAYPDYDEDFTKEFQAECEFVIKQVRNHPSLALICGGNEQREGWDEWGWKATHERFFGERLITEIIPPIAKRLAPEIPFIDNSPHGGVTCQSPVIGECHNWGNFYNSTKDPLFVTETCWTSESYSRPETLEKWMGLKVDDYVGPTWPEQWAKTTSLPLLNRMPYTNWFDYKSLRSYLHGLELEQMRADYSALSMFRYESPSNTGVIYWSFTKGGPLFQFGCVDYDGRPMMPYYAVKRLFVPFGIYPYRDISDICVIASNHSSSTQTAEVYAALISADGTIFREDTMEPVLGPGELARVMSFPDLYKSARDRTNQMFYVSARQEGVLVFEDIFFFCPFGEHEGVYKELALSSEKLEENTWRLDIKTQTPVRLVEIEFNHKVMLSDNYFPTLHGKQVEVKMLERVSDAPLTATIKALGADFSQEIVLE